MLVEYTYKESRPLIPVGSYIGRKRIAYPAARIHIQSATPPDPGGIIYWKNRYPKKPPPDPGGIIYW